MKLIWSKFASESLFEIYKYYKAAASKDVANKIKSRIFAATKQLLKYPMSGQIEGNLQKLGEDHR